MFKAFADTSPRLRRAHGKVNIHSLGRGLMGSSFFLPMPRALGQKEKEWTISFSVIFVSSFHFLLSVRSLTKDNKGEAKAAFRSAITARITSSLKMEDSII